MQMRFMQRDGFQICGYSVETSLDESGTDVAALYNDYFNTEKSLLIDNVAKNKGAELYGLMWYPEGHKRYRYLVGKETANLSEIPIGTELKKIPSALYAVAPLAKDNDGIKAWTDFFFEAIPQAGYVPDYEHGFFFEYYPDGVDGDYELWTPVVKADV
jgi:predicted transcriptional regulator YdeE